MTDIVSSSKAAAAGSHSRSRIIRAALIGALVAILISLMAGEFGRRLVFDGWQNLSPRKISGDNVVVVMVDDAGTEQLGSWPWPRDTMAQLVAEIGRGQPRAIGIDIYFSEPDPVRPEQFAQRYLPEELDAATRAKVLGLPQMDAVFAQVLGQTPSVLARAGVSAGGVHAGEVFVNAPVSGEAPPETPRASRLITSIFELDGVAMGHGMVNATPDSDGIIRAVPLAIVLEADGGATTNAPGFALELARMALSDDTAMRWEPDALILGERRLPTGKGGAMRFRMGEWPASADISAWDVLTGAVSPEVFADKIVILGVGATGTYDIVATPLRAEAFGAFVQAQAVDAIIEGAWLSRPVSVIVLEGVLAGLLVALIIIGGIMMHRRVTMSAWAIAALLAAALPFASWFAFTSANLLLDPLRPLAIAAGAAIGLALARYAITRQERARLALELVEERVRLSAQQGELNAARRIQMSMVPSPDALSQLDARIEVGAVLEPAKSIGGDFFDAFAVDENRVLFMVGDVTGKGVPAALFMALSKTMSKLNFTRSDGALDAAVGSLNRALMEEADEDMGLTLLVGLIDCATGAVSVVNAGHENPLILRANGTAESLVLTGGPPLCVIDFPYPTEHCQLTPGDTLVIITDGATEAARGDGALFGLERVVAALSKPHDSSAGEQAVALSRAVRDFEGGGEASDDLTILALRYRG